MITFREYCHLRESVQGQPDYQNLGYPPMASLPWPDTDKYFLDVDGNIISKVGARPPSVIDTKTFANIYQKYYAQHIKPEDVKRFTDYYAKNMTGADRPAFIRWLEDAERDCELIKLDPNHRVHATKQSNIIIKDAPNQEVGLKPHGLWYACGHEWIQWCKKENFEIGDLENKFILDIDFNKILILDSVDKMILFNKQYGIRDVQQREYWAVPNEIDWNEVSKNYQGIEICPYQWGLRNKFLWYYGWDVASGCIWNKQAIKNIIKL